MPAKTYQIPTPSEAPPWFVTWQAELSRTLADIATRLSTAQGQDGRAPTLGNTLDMQSNRVTGLAVPQKATDATTKGYVDAAVSSTVTSTKAGTGIIVSAETGDVVITNAGVTVLVAGDNITISRPSGSVTIRMVVTPSAAAVPTNFAANFYVPLRDAGGTLYYFPAMTAPW